MAISEFGYSRNTVDPHEEHGPLSGEKVNTIAFYKEYFGHQPVYLRKLHAITRESRRGQPVVWLAGDSSLDNKAWLKPPPGWLNETVTEPQVYFIPEIYKKVFDKPKCVKNDVAFWVNDYLQLYLEQKVTCINAAVEASMLRDRTRELLPQDKVIQECMTKEDILIVSVGANDIAMKPTLKTTKKLLKLAWLTSTKRITDGESSTFKYFEDLFGRQVQEYVAKLCAVSKPRAVIVCMIYFPLEAFRGQSGWADLPLAILGYSLRPKKLQTAIRTIFEKATCRIQVAGTEVIPCPLFERLDGKLPENYVERVEPSKTGGQWMAKWFASAVEDILKQPDARKRKAFGRRWETAKKL
jgi:hypothetical protein